MCEGCRREERLDYWRARSRRARLARSEDAHVEREVGVTQAEHAAAEVEAGDLRELVAWALEVSRAEWVEAGSGWEAAAARRRIAVAERFMTTADGVADDG